VLETTRLLLLNNQRNLIRNIRLSPVLYLFFSLMMIGSVIMFGVLTFFLLRAQVKIRIEELFFALFIIFLMKSAADMHNYYVKAQNVAYALSTPKKQQQTVVEIFLAILFTQLFIWFSLSSLYLIVVAAMGINIYYPLEYFFFFTGVVLATMIGSMMILHFFSAHRDRLVLVAIVFIYYWMSQNFWAVIVTFPGVLLYFVWTLRRAKDSYLFIPRKDRVKEKTQAHIRGMISSLCYRELTVLWRERLLVSFVFASVSTSVFSGYLAVYGTDIFIPESIQKITGNMLPVMFVFLGLYVIVIYTAVFPALNLFLTEEKTMWILRNLPVKNYDIVIGKTLALTLCYVASLPFLAYIIIFIGTDTFLFLLWLLSFSFIIGVVISVPLGAKYVGKKSDILLLYSVAMILFIIVTITASVGYMLRNDVLTASTFYIIMLASAGICLIISLRLSANILSQKAETKVVPRNNIV
jgi:hypothetical protein